MTNHKQRPKLKNYLKIGIVLNSKRQNNLSLKKQTINFYNPSSIYLSSKSSIKIKDNFRLYLSNRKKFKLYFGFHKTSHLKQLLRKDFLKNTKTRRFIKELEFCSLLERRLDLILLRLGFVATLFEAKHLISHKKIKVNNLPNASYSRFLNRGDIISFEPSIEPLIKKRIVEQLENRAMFFNTLSNVEVNYTTLKIIILKNKINFSQQLQHYFFLLNWKILINE